MKNKGADVMKEYLDAETTFLDKEILKSTEILPGRDDNIEDKIEQLQSQVYLLNLSNR